MKAQEMCAALHAFAHVAEGSRASELCKFATVFDGGKQETVAARVKRAPTGLKYPPALKEGLAAIAAGLTACGAKKQAQDIEAILALFTGPANGKIEEFVNGIAAALAAPPPSRRPAKTAGSQGVVDNALARELADELARTVLDPPAFAEVLRRLEDSKRVSNGTLMAAANQFLGNKKSYKGRKSVIDDIIKRQRQDARFSARGKALAGLGV